MTVTVEPLDSSPGFAVEDDGPGLDRRARDDSRIRLHDGTGRDGVRTLDRHPIVEAHGCDLAIEPGGDGGARFEVTGVDPRC